MAMVFACPNERHCRECGQGDAEKRICALCDKSFLNVDKVCDMEITNKVDNCLTYELASDKTVCSACEFGYVLNVNNHCDECMAHDCAVCFPNGVCKACKTGFGLVDGVCVAEVTCNDRKCAICEKQGENEEICHKCHMGFAKFDDSLCRKGVFNCDIMDGPAKCKRCLPNFFVDRNGNCLHNTHWDWTMKVWIILVGTVLSLALTAYCLCVVREKRQQEEEGFALIN